MNDQQRTALTGPGVMLISAGIFGFFGYTTTFIYTSSTTNQFLLFVALYAWTLRIATIAFVVSAGITFVSPVFGNLLYALFGLASGVTLAVSGALDLADPQHTVNSPYLTFLFAFIIVIVSIGALRDALTARAMNEAARGADGFEP